MVVRPRALGLLLLVLAPLPASPVSGTATVVRDVAPVFNTPEGREAARLRGGDRVTLLGAVDRRRGSAGAVWVRVRRPGPAGARGWMRARDLAPENPQPATGRARVVGPAESASPDETRRRSSTEADGAWALRGPPVDALEGREIPIVDMDFDCRGGASAGHFETCELITVFELSPAVPRDALAARAVCEVAVDWTGVSGTEYRQLARGSVPLPLEGRSVESSITLSYDFHEAATGALVASQRCVAAAR